MMDTSEIRRMYGRAEIQPNKPVVAGSTGTWRLTYHVGEYGIDDGGSILVANRFASDMGVPQTERSSEINYVTAETVGKAKLRIRYDPRGYVRPWRKTIRIDVSEGYLVPGDTVTIVYGDRSKGSPGMEMQTFCEESYEFKVVVDPLGTGMPTEIPSSPALKVVGGEAAKIVALLPSLVNVSESFPLVVRVEDGWGNPSPLYRGTIEINGPESLRGAPARYCFGEGDAGVRRFEGLSLERAGVYSLRVHDVDADLKAESNSILATETGVRYHAYWGDLHGQSEETIGTNTVDDYFRFARGVSALDFCAHQGNDFQITHPIWRKIQRAVKRYHESGRFVTFLGYEWSGNTPAGGDHNVYFLRDDEHIYRSSHAQIPDKSDVASDRYPLTKLYEELRGRDAMIIPHVGGRPSNLQYHDPELEPLVEIYSEWGEFEWMLHEVLRRGYRVGFIAGSDDHKGRPGAAAPGRAAFGVYGGLICAYAKELTREALWESFFSRRCYATTGQRILLLLRVEGYWMGEECEVDAPPKIEVEVAGTAPIERVEVMRGMRRVFQLPTQVRRVENAVRVVWGGARVRGRERIAVWDGWLSLDRGRILEAQGYALDSPAEEVRFDNERRVSWASSTAGDEDGVVLRLDTPRETVLTFSSPLTTFSTRLEEVFRKPVVRKVGGLDLRVKVEGLPEGTGSRHVKSAFVDRTIPRGLSPYYVRVLQVDGAKAWSSPVYVHY